jgi:hypothetical protein
VNPQNVFVGFLCGWFGFDAFMHEPEKSVVGIAIALAFALVVGLARREVAQRKTPG